MFDPSSLPGTHRTRVFVGGSYQRKGRLILSEIENAVRSERFEPIVADKFALLRPDVDVHDVTLYLLHACRLAVFEMSTLSGALMEMERCLDYGINRVLILFHDTLNRSWPEEADAWETTAMAKSLANENRVRFTVMSYIRPRDAARQTKTFLRAIRRSVYGQLHSL